MNLDRRVLPISEGASAALQVYLLGQIEFETALALQRQLVYQVGGDRSGAALIVCEHSPLITVGRQGSRTHILYEPEELFTRGWKVRWVNRGGGCQLHLPGQLAIYPILPLDRLGLGLQAYLERLQSVLIAALDDFSVRARTFAGRTGVWVGQRPVATVGVAVRDWVSYHGAYLNINPDLELMRRILPEGLERERMTSLERERRGPLRPALVRESFLGHFAARFSFQDMALFFDHPSISRRARSDAVAASS